MYKDSPNLGDDIQTYAAHRFLPRVDYIIDREMLDGFYTQSGEPVAAIMNGWYLYEHLNWPPSPFIMSLVTSIHFDTFFSSCLDGTILDNFVLDGYGADWLIANGPVGCRDDATMALLAERKIPAYFSGCITLTLDKFQDVTCHGQICVVDVAPQVVGKILKLARKPVLELSHYIELGDVDFERRMKLVEDRLRIYQGASLLVTGRLHAALPCLALGTPVLFLKEDWAMNRIGTYLQYLNYISLEDFISGDIKWDFDSPSENPDGYLKIRDKLHHECVSFIQKCEQNRVFTRCDTKIFEESVRRTDRLKTLMKLKVDKLKQI